MESIFGAIDEAVKSWYKINDAELDFICEQATEKEMSEFVDGIGTYGQSASFAEKRKALEIRNKYLTMMYNK
jgi:hypothetical protein